MKNIDRSSVNEGQYAAPEFPKSGFNLSHRRYSSYLIGRIHVSGYQETMPSDKISGENRGNFTMKVIRTPMVAPVDVAQYNMYIPYRALDRTFERAFAPSKHNNMSQSWKAPTFNLRSLVDFILRGYANQTFFSTDAYSTFAYLFQVLGTTDLTDDSTLSDVFSEYSFTFNQLMYEGFTVGDVDYPAIMTLIRNSLLNDGGLMHDMAKKMYIDDALIDVYDLIVSRLGDSQHRLNPDSVNFREFVFNTLSVLFDPFVGRFSYLAELGYNYLRPSDYYRIAYKVGFFGGSIRDFIDSIDSTPQNEYALRAMYVIWYEHFRNVDLEPVSDDLPYWRDFGSNSIFDLAASGNLFYTLYRICSWYKDMFTTAQIDDLSRHVYAPIFYYHRNAVQGHVQDVNNQDAGHEGNAANAFQGNSKPANYTLTWIDQISGLQKNIVCPVPANVNDVLAREDLAASDVFGLDLNSLKQSQMLERYLKRNYLFGDEYQDRMLAHYNSRVSDLRINRPEIIGRSFGSADYGQEIANMTNAQTSAGTRTATGTLQSSGDNYVTFCEEFGIVINLLTFMPTSVYSGTCPQRLLASVVDYPLPEFATNNEEFGRKREIADSGIITEGTPENYMFGRYPAYHAWRSRVDEVGGLFLNEMQDCTFRRFWGLQNEDNTPKLNYYFLHCRPNLQMFENTVMYDSQIYGDVVHDCFVERVLPTPVEVI